MLVNFSKRIFNSTNTNESVKADTQRHQQKILQIITTAIQLNAKQIIQISSQQFSKPNNTSRKGQKVNKLLSHLMIVYDHI